MADLLQRYAPTAGAATTPKQKSEETTELPTKRRRFFHEPATGDENLPQAATDVSGSATEANDVNISSTSIVQPASTIRTEYLDESNASIPIEYHAKPEPADVSANTPVSTVEPHVKPDPTSNTQTEGFRERYLKPEPSTKWTQPEVELLRVEHVSSTQSSALSSLPVQPATAKHSHSNTKAEVIELDSVISSEVSKVRPPTNWSRRYIGSFQVDGWATRSGTGLLVYGEKIGIKRVARKVSLGSNMKMFGSTIKAKENDIMVRFTNPRGLEIGRLPTDKAKFVSALMDLGICSFEGNCIYASERLSTGDNIYIQLDCFLSRSAFKEAEHSETRVEKSTPFKSQDETPEEKLLRLRQLALIKLFIDVGLKPFKSAELLKQHKAKGKLEAAAMAEQFDIKIGSPPSAVNSSDNDDDDGTAIEEGQLDALYKKAQRYDYDMPEHKPADTFNMDLRAYQKQGLGWMIAREQYTADDNGRKITAMNPLWEEYRWPIPEKELPASEPDDRFYMNPYSGELSLEFPKIQKTCLGGILADEMGLGKTISTMSLIHSSPHVGSQSAAMLKAERRKFAYTTTLIVAPMSLLTQWESEAQAASKNGSVIVIVYYGDERNMDLDSLCLSPGSTPIMLITSYGVVSTEFQKFSKGQSSKLFKMQFLRIVLDEAHTIRNRASLMSRACCGLQAERKWALTGTPIVNRLEDLYSLVKFLGVEPWNHFPFWKTFITAPYESKEFLRALDVVQTILEPILLRRTKTMKAKDGTPLVVLPPKEVHIESIELTETERAVYDLFYRRAKQTFTASVAAGTVMKSYTTIFAQILRLRQSCDHPLLVQSAMQADEMGEDGTVTISETVQETDDSQILDPKDDSMTLKRLLERFKTSEAVQSARQSYGVEVMRRIQDGTEQECPICSAEPIETPVVTPCWHMSCRSCLIAHIKFQKEHGQEPRCHSCRETISADSLYEVVRQNGKTKPAVKEDLYLRRYKPESSAKISHLIAKLISLRQEEPSTKCVVFSQFTSFLDLIEPALKRDHFEFMRIDGRSSQLERARVLEKFKVSNTGEPLLLLLSLKTGGVGLNLVTASKVFMMDPWWSYAVEAQAIDRIHRMGQTRSVSVYRFIVKGSVEERMLKIQDRKKFLASSLGMMSEDQKRLQSVEDIKLLFE
ncbi:SNF2 family N-terminal domain-containing protein [Limtongia smithiae]|uniref:SNF2 family N-terminal domain-containing protein n=1 Tax=Limtongia smithiae TaxID=1125753 RepID=UPI0034CEEF69